MAKTFVKDECLGGVRRAQLIKKIQTLKNKFKNFSRGCFCHAITILDTFMLKNEKKMEEVVNNQVDEYVLAFSCLILAHKYLNAQKIHIEAFIKHIFGKSQISIMKQKMIQMEGIILETIEFQLPTSNAYQILDSCVITESESGSVNSRMALVSLKILMVGFMISPILSLHPQLAIEIHSITMKKVKITDVSPNALTVYQLVLKHLGNNQ